MGNPLHSYATTVPFGDTDASGWMHFPNIFRYAEAAEHDFLRSRGLLVFDSSRGGWPRVKVTCDYKLPLVTGENILVHLGLTKIGAASITWHFEIFNSTGAVAAFGSMTNVRVGATGKPLEISVEERTRLTSPNLS